MTSGTTRLHISPFTPALLETVLNPSLRSSAADISFHTLETFPENQYGYVNLPTMEAVKLKKKLNGSILKGKKMKVDEAKPKKRHRVEEGEKPPSAEDNCEATESKKSSKKRKADRDVLPGHELSPSRHVKRGWTEPSKRDKHAHKSKTKEKKTHFPRSKYTDDPECLFLTNPPANHAAVEKADKKKSDTKKGKDAVVVHEFAKTIKHPTFLRSGENAEAATLTDDFVEGKGWVTRGGDVKEPANSHETKPTKRVPGRVTGGKDKITKIPKRPAKEASPQESSTDPSESESSSSATSSSEEDTDSSESEDDDSETSSTASSSVDSSSSSSYDDDESVHKVDTLKLDDPKASSAPTQDPPLLGTPVAETPKKRKDVEETTSKSAHPLETLFKLPVPATPQSEPRPSLEINTQFSFFGGDIDDNGDDDNVEGTAGSGLEPPQTPFTKQDLRTRGIRSAAPTPDTAGPKRINFWENNDNNNNDYDNEGDDEHYPENESNNPKKKWKEIISGEAQSKGKGKIAGAEGGDFASWFWENRGENNRAWKKRRREAAKEVRQRENRRKGNKGK